LGGHRCHKWTKKKKKDRKIKKQKKKNTSAGKLGTRSEKNGIRESSCGHRGFLFWTQGETNERRGKGRKVDGLQLVVYQGSTKAEGRKRSRIDCRKKALIKKPRQPNARRWMTGGMKGAAYQNCSSEKLSQN